MLSALDLGKVKVTVDIGPLIDAAVRSGFDDEDEAGCNHDPSAYISQGPFTFDVDMLEDLSQHIIEIDYEPGRDRKPVSVFLGGEIIYHGDGLLDLPREKEPEDPLRARLRESIKRIRELAKQAEENSNADTDSPEN